MDNGSDLLSLSRELPVGLLLDLLPDGINGLEEHVAREFDLPFMRRVRPHGIDLAPDLGHHDAGKERQEVNKNKKRSSRWSSLLEDW